MIKFGGLRAKTYNYFMDDGSEEKKKQKDTKKCVIKRKIKFQSYRNCSGVTKQENKRNHLEKSKIDKDSLKKDQQEFIKNNKLILKHSNNLKVKGITF